VILLVLAAAVPGLFWDAPPDTAPALREAGITSIQVPAAQYNAWKDASGLSVSPADLRRTAKALPPTVQYRANEASATRAPWLVSNGWRFLRNPAATFLYDVHGGQSALAAAEAYCFGGAALIHTDSGGLKPFAEMVEFLRSLGGNDAPSVADIGFVDDGSSAAGEVMNMMVRNNLLFRLVPERARSTDPHLKITVRLGSKEYPLEEAKNPSLTAHEVRAHLTDDRRSLRIYGSPVVVARLTVTSGGVRVHLLNYAGVERKVDGVRVRVLGSYPKHHLSAAGSPQVELLDYAAGGDATEFTLPELKTYAVVDLSR
jgi:hypothetical protein